MSKPWILCMFSGGLDSTGVVYQLLTNPVYKDYDIHVHSMTLYNREGRGKAEFDATTKIKQWFSRNSHAREFVFTRSTHEYNFMINGFIWDMDMCAFMASQIAKCSTINKYKYIAMGRTKTDLETVHVDFHNRMERAQNIVNSIFSKETFRERPEYIFPVVDMTKKEIWDMLPKELRELTWSCRYPTQDENFNFVICGECQTCKELASVQV